MKKDLGAVILFVALYIIVSFMFGTLFVEWWRATTPLSFEFFYNASQTVQLFILFIMQELVLLALFALVYYRWQKTFRWQTLKQFFLEKFKWKGWLPAIQRSIGGIIIYLFLNALLANLLEQLGWQIPGLYGEQMVMTILSDMPLTAWYEYLCLILLAVVLGPVVEELIFRGFITHTLSYYRQGWGVLVAAILFAVAHMERGVIFNLLLLSLFLGYIYRKTGSLWYSLLFHMGINGLAVMVLIAT